MDYSAYHAEPGKSGSMVAEPGAPERAGELVLHRAFEPIEGQWRGLERDGDCYVFQTYDWLHAWFRHIGQPQGIEPAIVCLSNNAGAPVAILPLCLERRGLAKVLTWMGGIVADYHGPILQADAPSSVTADLLPRTAAFIAERCGKVDAIHLERQPGSLGPTPNPMIGPSALRHREDAHFARLTRDWETFYKAHAGSKTRATDRRKDRRLADTGELSVTAVRQPADALAVFEEMLRQRQAWSSRTGSRNRLEEDRFSAFCREVLTRHCGKRMVRLSVLRSDDAIIAAEWGLLHHGRYYYFLPTYSADSVRRYSPGRLLLRRNLEYCFDEGLEIFDFTIGDEPYKADWCDETLKLFDYLDPLTLRGEFYVLQRRLRGRLHASNLLVEVARSLRRLSRRRFSTHGGKGGA